MINLYVGRSSLAEQTQKSVKIFINVAFVKSGIFIYDSVEVCCDSVVSKYSRKSDNNLCFEES